MKRTWCLLIVGVIFLATNSTLVLAVDMTNTGFYWPIGESEFDHGSGDWLERDPAHGGGYFNGFYHIGIDMLTRDYDPGHEESHVYAIADGIIIKKHCDNYSWGTGNCALFIRHKTLNNGDFVALYGHIRTTLEEDDEVRAGEYIGYTGYYATGIHLHFGIHPGGSVPYANSNQGIGWGRMTNNHWPDTNGFVDPIHFLNTHYPANYLSYFYISEGNLHLAWSPSNVPCDKARIWAYNQTCSAENNHPGICSTFYDELAQQSDLDCALEQYHKMLFGTIEEFQQFLP